MKLSHSTLLAVLASSVAVQAAPAPIVEKLQTQLAKRDDLERALAQYEELQALKVKRTDLANELAEREYEIVTQVLTAIKDTDLAPVVLKFFVSNDTLKNLTITGLEYVIKSGLISLQQLLDLAVQSGLVVSVVNDVLTNCTVYVSIIDLVESLVKNVVLGLLSKREGPKRPYTLEEGMELLRRDGLMQAGMLEGLDAEKRDVDDIIVNLLESLAESGLATQVVETVLTDLSFLLFGAELIKELNSEGLINISSLISAVTLSGLLSQLVKEFLNFDTIKEIALTAIDAFDGNCSGTTLLNLTLTSTTSTSTSSSTSSSGSLISSLLGGSSLLSGALGLVGSLFGGSSGSSSSSGTETTTATTVAALSTVQTMSTSAADPCATAVIKRERLRMY